MLLVQNGGPRPFRIVARFADVETPELVRTFLVVLSRGEPPLDMKHLQDVFPQLGSGSICEIGTPNCRYYFFPESDHGSWKLHDAPRKGSFGSDARYLGDWEGEDSKLFAMIQFLGEGCSTSRHAHYQEGVQEFWCVTAGSATFTLEREGHEVRNLVSVGSIITACQGEIHQTIADEDFEAVLVVRGTTRSAHNRDHHFVRRHGSLPIKECSLAA